MKTRGGAKANPNTQVLISKGKRARPGPGQSSPSLRLTPNEEKLLRELSKKKRDNAASQADAVKRGDVAKSLRNEF